MINIRIIDKILSVFLLISIFFTTIVYSAFSTQLQISGEAVVRSDQVIRITNLSVKQQTGGAFETYNNKYGKDTTGMYITLPVNGSIIYEVTITNKDTKKYVINEIQKVSHTNNNVSVNIGLNIGDIINANSTKTFTVTVTNSTSSQQNETLLIKYGFTSDVKAENLSYSNDNTGVDCSDAQCMIDAISNMLD